jgi:hypothetical protein
LVDYFKNRRYGESTQIIGSVLKMLKNNLGELNEPQILGYNSAERIVLEIFGLAQKSRRKKNNKKELNEKC